MKKHLIFLAVWALCGAITLATAQQPIVRFEKDDITKSINVQLANLMKNSTEVAIQDVNGQVWYNKYIARENGYYMGLNFYGLPDGDYVIYARNREGMKAKAISSSAANLEFYTTVPSESKVQAANFMPVNYANSVDKLIYYFTDEGSMNLGIQLANLQQKPVFINLVAMGYGPVFTREINNENGVAFKVNMEGITKGDFFLYVRTDEANLMQFFKVTTNDIQLGELQKLDNAKKAPAADKVITLK